MTVSQFPELFHASLEVSTVTFQSRQRSTKQEFHCVFSVEALQITRERENNIFEFCMHLHWLLFNLFNESGISTYMMGNLNVTKST